MKKLLLYSLPFLLVFISSFHLLKTDAIINYLNTKDTLTVDSRQYKLSWSSHPGSNYYKQEYLPVGEKADHYKSMVLVDYLLIDTPAKYIVGVKVDELVERKKTDAVANLMVRKNPQTGDYLFDFIISEGNGDHASVVELNAYRYKNYTDNAGHKGVLLFALSKRAYGNDVRPFLEDLRTQRQNIIKAIAITDFPAVEIK